MTNFQVEERAKLKRHWVEQAIALAMQSKWEEAVGVNRSILEQFPKDVETLNRFGRALTELGRYRDARDAYQRAVQADPLNTIAQKNLTRLSALSVETAPRPTAGRVDPRFFIAESGNTGVANLVRVVNREIVARMAVGDQVSLHSEGRILYVRTARGENLGQVEPKLSQRLIDLMKGGNTYAAALMSLSDSNVRIIIRETHQDPSQSGKLSFPARGDQPGVRSYIRGSLIKYENDEEDDDGLDDGELGVDGDADDAEEAPDAAEFEEESTNE